MRRRTAVTFLAAISISMISGGNGALSQPPLRVAEIAGEGGGLSGFADRAREDLVPYIIRLAREGNLLDGQGATGVIPNAAPLDNRLRVELEAPQIGHFWLDANRGEDTLWVRFMFRLVGDGTHTIVWCPCGTGLDATVIEDGQDVGGGHVDLAFRFVETDPDGVPPNPPLTVLNNANLVLVAQLANQYVIRNR